MRPPNPIGDPRPKTEPSSAPTGAKAVSAKPPHPVPLSEADRLFEAIANYTYDWESWLGHDGQPLWINPAVERMTGYRVAECLAMEDYPLPLVHEEDRGLIALGFRSGSFRGRLIQFGLCASASIFFGLSLGFGFRLSGRFRICLSFFLRHLHSLLFCCDSFLFFALQSQYAGVFRHLSGAA